MGGAAVGVLAFFSVIFERERESLGFRLGSFRGAKISPHIPRDARKHTQTERHTRPHTDADTDTDTHSDTHSDTDTRTRTHPSFSCSCTIRFGVLGIFAHSILKAFGFGSCAHSILAGAHLFYRGCAFAWSCGVSFIILFFLSTESYNVSS